MAVAAAGGARAMPPGAAPTSAPRSTWTFEEAVFGVEKEIEITRDEVCSTCRGTGAEPGHPPTRCATCGGKGEVRQVRQTFLGSMVQVTTCPTCNGTGEVIATPCHTCRGRGLERKTVRKAHLHPGRRGYWHPDPPGRRRPARRINGGPNGNFYVEIQVKPHKYFRRRQDDILLDLSINVAQATLGAEIDVPTVDGPAQLNIPAGTQPGKVFTLKGKGVPHLRSSGRGDELVIVTVRNPWQTDRRAAQAVRAAVPAPWAAK